jgi:hypothetical protein
MFRNCWKPSPQQASLKVPKCEIFDRSDFGDFYTMGFIWGREIPYMYAQSNFKGDFFLVWAKIIFFSRSFWDHFLSVNSDFLNFSMFYVLKK